ncbi:MAG TPA: class I SAM-dependent methyltransferase [Terracidiphilus sp.]|nr:class I SAM-dependent methyltransferase [Terracidiphilus sp.]
METGRASRTALRVAHRRAVHQVLDDPPVLNDPVAVAILGPDFGFDRDAEMHPWSRAFRAFMVARSRYAEDQLARAVAEGVRQYVVLGAGLDTFACRNPFKELRVFEVDFPATQEWKRALLAEMAQALPGGAIPETLTFVPLDFEHKTLSAGLAEAGFNASERAFFGWLGVVPYLTKGAFQSTIQTIAQLPTGSGMSFDYGLAPRILSPERRKAFDVLAERVAAAGEPFRLFFTPEELDHELRSAGFRWVEQVDSAELNRRYFSDRGDGLGLPQDGIGMMATAWV